jgi:hypothetical protein
MYWEQTAAVKIGKLGTNSSSKNRKTKWDNTNKSKEGYDKAASYPQTYFHYSVKS